MLSGGMNPRVAPINQMVFRFAAGALRVFAPCCDIVRTPILAAHKLTK
jgi:hypothetical protein